MLIGYENLRHKTDILGTDFGCVHDSHNVQFISKSFLENSSTYTITHIHLYKFQSVRKSIAYMLRNLET